MVCVQTISTEEMRQVEDRAHGLGLLKIYMMENAGAGVANHIISRFKNLSKKRIVAVAGTGNNGGDAFVAARHLTYHAAKITVILLGSPPELRTDDTKTNWSILEKMNSVELIFASEVTKDIARIIRSAQIIIDGIFGTGIKGSIREPHSSAIDAINASKAYVVAVDVPSGLDPDTGEFHDKCVRADATVTFHRMKKGLPRNKRVTGRVIVHSIGIPPDFE